MLKAKKKEVNALKISRKRYVAVRDNKTKVLMDRKNNFYCHLPRQPQIDAMWKNWNEIGQARVLSWNSKNTAIAALKNSIATENINDYEIIEMIETFEI